MDFRILGNAQGLETLDEAILRGADAQKKNKYCFILDVDSTEDPAYGKQECCVYNGHFGKNCFHPNQVVQEHPALGQNQLPTF